MYAVSIYIVIYDKTTDLIVYSDKTNGTDRFPRCREILSFYEYEPGNIVRKIPLCYIIFVESCKERRRHPACIKE